MSGITQRNETSARRRRSQRGSEIIEFAFFAFIAVPPLLWMFINGMNFLRFDKANDVTRAAALMYIKGQNFTYIGTQEIVSLVASGLNLQVGTSGGAAGSGTGSGLIILSTVQYIGPNTCTNCANLNHYVFLSQVKVGNASLQFNGTTVASAIGSPLGADWSSTTGSVSNSQTDSGNQVAASFSTIWTSNGQQISIGDGELVYVVESFFAPSYAWGTGAFGGGGVYARALM